MLVKNGRKKRRLNPVYWIIQFIGGIIAISGLFWIPAIVSAILGG